MCTHSFARAHDAIDAPVVLAGDINSTSFQRLRGIANAMALLQRGSLAAGQLAYLLRFLCYDNLVTIASLGPWGLWAVLPVELLHGLTFAVNW